jgi:hypothetical protein
VPELRARTKGEKPPRTGDRYGGDPLLVVPAGTPLTEAAVAAYEARPEHRPDGDPE